MKILVIEDDACVAQTLQRLLGCDCCAVDLAAEAETGLQLAETFSYSLILLDAGLSQLDEISLCQHLRRKGLQIPILLLVEQEANEKRSLPGRNALKEIASSAGADDAILKPFNPDECRARVQTLLSRPDPAELQAKPASELPTAAALAAITAIKEELQQYRDLFEFAPDAYLVTDRQGVIQKANRAASALFNVTAADLVETMLSSYIAGPDRPEFYLRLAHCNFAENWEVTVQPRAGNSVLAAIAVAPLKNAQQEITGWHWSLRDISLRKQMEQDSEQRLHLFVRFAPVSVAMFDRNMRYLAVSQRWIDTHQLESIESVLGQYHYKLLPIPDRWRQVHQQGLAGQRVKCEEDYLILPDGSVEWLEWEVQPWRTANGEVGGIFIFVDDITDRKRSEQKIREQAALLDIASDAIFVRDLDHRILYWNQGAERLYGWQAAAAIGQSAIDLFQNNLTQIDEITAALLQAGSWRGEMQKTTQTGRRITVEARWTLVRDQANQPKFVLSVDTDITEKKQMEAQFYRAQRLESLGTLASGIAHDLNNVLTPILGVAQLLRFKLTDLEPQLQDMLQVLEDSTRRGANMVQQILVFSRGTSGERILVQVDALLQEVIKVVRQTFPKTILVSEPLLDPSPWLVSADPTHLHQVVMNLCVNARDAMPAGGTLTLTAENYRVDDLFAQMDLDARVGDYVVITVTDTGTGIPPEVRDRMFEPFFTTKTMNQGTGLGLSTVSGIVKGYGGFVEVQSQMGVGSQFKVYLPALKTAAPPSESQMPLPQGQGELVLIVDDEAMILQSAQVILETHSYQVMTARNGEEAIACYATHADRIQIVLIDMMLPEIDGPTIIRALQAVKPDVRVIAMSGLSGNYRQQLQALGITALLTKPFTTAELLQSLALYRRL